MWRIQLTTKLLERLVQYVNLCYKPEGKKKHTKILLIILNICCGGEELIATICSFKYPAPLLYTYTVPRLQIACPKGHSQVKHLL